MTEDDIISKLREANVFNFAKVRAVVMETTSDISVLHSADPDERLDERFLTSVLLE